MFRDAIILTALLGLFAYAPCIAQDWLDGGYVGRAGYGDIGQYFTEPIFYTNLPTGYSAPAYTGDVFWREPLRLGSYVVRPIGPWSYTPYNTTYWMYPSSPWQSDFRDRSLATLGTGTVSQNWTRTMIYAQGRSSMRVYDNGVWRSV